MKIILKKKKNISNLMNAQYSTWLHSNNQRDIQFALNFYFKNIFQSSVKSLKIKKKSKMKSSMNGDA